MNWSDWMSLSPEQQEERRRKYRAEVKAESDAARASNYKRMDTALAGKSVPKNREAR